MAKAKIDIGVACRPEQFFSWWVNLTTLMVTEQKKAEVEINGIRATSSMLVDSNKNRIIGNPERHFEMTDKNRNSIADGFLSGTSDYIFWIDDDTTPPHEAISTLIKSGHEITSGLYFSPYDPFLPVAYKLAENGMYAPVHDWSENSLFEVDSIGMGCVLIHRSVYEKIAKEHEVFRRNNGSVMVFPKNKIQKPVVTEHKKRVEPYVKAGVWHEQITPVQEGDEVAYPYYVLEHGRTEDHYFCELASNVGIKPWLDTSVTCGHWKMKPTTLDDYRQNKLKDEGFV